MFLRSRGSEERDSEAASSPVTACTLDRQNLRVAEERSFTRQKPFQAAVRFFRGGNGWEVGGFSLYP